MADRTIQINSFKYGLDTRRESLASLPGTLQTAENCHVNSGGEIEKRKAFVKLANFFADNTFGLQDTDQGLVTFGADATPNQPLPPGVTYQQLPYPYGSAIGGSMAAVLFSCSYLGKAFVLAKYSYSNTVFAFYNGSLVFEITDGIVLNGALVTPETISQLSVDLAAIVNRLGGWLADANVTALPYNGVDNNTNWLSNIGYLETALAGATLVMSPPGVHFTPTIVNNNSASGILGAKLIDQNYPGIGAVSASVAFTINAGTAGNLTVTAPAHADGTGTAAVSGGTLTMASESIGAFAIRVGAAINNNTFLTGYTAKVQGSTITVYAPSNFGAFQNVTPHALIVDTTGDVTTVAGTVFTQVSVSVARGTPVFGNNQGLTVVYVSLTASVTGLTAGATVTFTWSLVDSLNQDIGSQFITVQGAYQIALFSVVGASSAVSAQLNPGVDSVVARLRCTAKDNTNNTTSTLFFTVTLTGP